MDKTNSVEHDMPEAGMKLRLTDERWAQGGIGLIMLSYIALIFSSPMSQHVSSVEVGMGLGLTLGTAILGLLLMKQGKPVFARTIALVSVGYLLAVPSVVGMWRGNAGTDMVRDLIPLLFITVLPLVLIFVARSGQRDLLRTTLISGLVFVGLVSSTQFISGINEHYGSVSAFVSANKAYYLAPHSMETEQLMELASSVSWREHAELFLKAYDPSVLFSAIYLVCFGLSALLVSKTRRPWAGAAAIGAGLIPMYVLMALGLRAYVGVFIMAVVLFAARLLFREKISRKVLLFTVILAGLSLAFLHDVIELLLIKQAVAGSNGKIVELYAVLDTLRAEHLLLGTGWGGLLANPIIMELPTRFTHSLLSFYLLKGGVIGLSVLLMFFLSLGLGTKTRQLATSTDRIMIVVACLGPILMGLFFQPVYKMLSFGIVLALLYISLGDGEERMPPRPAS